MRIHCFQHSPVEGPGHIADWAAARGHELSATHWYRGDADPQPAAIDLLVIMGGGMNIYEHRNHPWLIREKRLIGKVIEAGKPSLGICLGSQLIADVMGGKVFQNPEIEIGWFPVQVASHARENPLFLHIPAAFTAFHWHGDTFSLPPGAMLLASSRACPNQAFICEGNAVGLQFHAEVRPQDVRGFLDAETEPLPQGEYVQSNEAILAGDIHMPAIHGILNDLLDALADTVP